MQQVMSRVRVTYIFHMITRIHFKAGCIGLTERFWVEAHSLLTLLKQRAVKFISG